MKLFKKLIFIFLSIGALISCDGMDATYKEFIEEGPIVYIGKVDSLKAYAGRNRVMLEWQKLLDPRAKTAKIFWENRTKSTELQLTDKATLTQVVVEDLAEGSYVFEICTYDTYGNSSIMSEVPCAVYGDVYDEACEYALKLAEEKGLTFVHPFDDLDVATGQGSIAMEIIKELPTVDYILVPIGGGGLATGVSTLAKLLNPNIKVIGVEPSGANCLQESLKAGKVVTLPTVSTIADGTAVKTPGSKLFPYLQKNLDDIITVPDEDLIVAFLDMVENHKMIVENSGLLTVAALKQLDVKDKKIVSILSGGNMDVITMSSVVQQGLVQRSRIFTVSVLLPDKPGELVRVASIIAEANGNVIKLEHNQFVSINRKATVELRITIEAFGHEHKDEIVDKLEAAGLRPRIVKVNI